MFLAENGLESLKIGIGELNDQLCHIARENPKIAFYSMNGMVASVVRTGRVIGNGRGKTEIHAVCGKHKRVILVEVTEEIKGERQPVLIDRHNGLGEDFVPPDIIHVPKGKWLWNQRYNVITRKTCAEPYYKMAQAAEAEGVLMRITSAYRSYESQVRILAELAAENGEKRAKEIGAPPGFSEHQLGLALDVGGWVDENGTFVTENEIVYKWIEKNCHKYGFILKNPRGKEHITGGIYEPWHIRYIGDLDICAYIYQQGITLNEYLENLPATE